MRRLPLHPLLVAAFPVLSVWSQNLGETTGADALPVLAVTVALSALAWAVAAAAYRDARRSALFTAGATFLAMSYGHLWGDAVPAIGVTVWILAAAAVAWAVTRLRDGLGAATAIANTAGVALVLAAGLPIVLAAVTGGGATALADGGRNVDATRGPGRDIYYIVLDRYGREDSLREVFGYDNSAFVGLLEDAGFEVADRSLANYPKTAHSLAASLNMTYLDELASSLGPGRGGDWQPVYRMLRDHAVGDMLTDWGYEYLHVGTWWSPTATSDHAHRTLRYDTASEFTQVFETTTILPAAKQLLGLDAELDTRGLRRAHSAWQLDRLEELARQDHPGQRFVFVHITLPHEPYVFEADGSEVPVEVERSRTRTENFVPQLEYLNRRMAAIVEALLDGPREEHPIVVIQADEGPHPEERVRQGPGYRWDRAPLAELQEKLRILNAYYLPDVDPAELREDITPVNTFRLLFDTYFGTDLGQLDDRVYIFPDESHLYTYTDVTEVIRGGERPPGA